MRLMICLFDYWRNITISKIIIKLKRFWYDIQCFFERGKKGYCWRDVMDIDYFLINLLPNMLEEFNQKRNGYPGRLVLEHPDLSDDERSAIWGEYIKEIIQHFKNGNEDTCDQKNEWEEIVNNILLQDFPQIGSCLVYKQINEDDSEEIKELKRTYQKYFAREAELTEYRKSEVQKGFQMLSEIFGDLWY